MGRLGKRKEKEKKRGKKRGKKTIDSGEIVLQNVNDIVLDGIRPRRVIHQEKGLGKVMELLLKKKKKKKEEKKKRRKEEKKKRRKEEKKKRKDK